MTVNGALVFEKNVSFRRFVIKSWNCYIICHKIIKVWRVRAIKKVALLSTRYNILYSPPPLYHQQLSLRYLHDGFICCPEEIYDIFIFMRPTLLLPASLFPFHNLLIQPSSRTQNNFTFDAGLKCLPVYWWSYLTATWNWEVISDGKAYSLGTVHTTLKMLTVLAVTRKICNIYTLKTDFHVKFQSHLTENLIKRINLLMLCRYIICITYLLTYCMEQSPSWEANWFCS